MRNMIPHRTRRYSGTSGWEISSSTSSRVKIALARRVGSLSARLGNSRLPAEMAGVRGDQLVREGVLEQGAERAVGVENGPGGQRTPLLQRIEERADLRRAHIAQEALAQLRQNVQAEPGLIVARGGEPFSLPLLHPAAHRERRLLAGAADVLLLLGDHRQRALGLLDLGGVVLAELSGRAAKLPAGSPLSLPGSRCRD